MWEYLVYSYILIPVFALFYLILRRPFLILVSKYYKHYYKALSLYDCKLIYDAIEEMEKAIEINSKDWKAYSSLSLCYILIGENKKALDYLQKSISLSNSKDPNAFMDLALLYTEEERDFDKAIEMMKKAENIMMKKYKNTWKNWKGIIFSAFAWIYYKKGDYDESIKFYNLAEKNIRKLLKKYKTIEKNLSLTDSFYHLGIISKHMGKYDEAKEWFKKSIKAGGPESIFSKRSKEELKELQKG